MSFTSLHLCKQFYLTYPQIIRSVTEETKQVQDTPTELLVNRLSFTHIVELIKNETHLKRVFYETEAIRNNWSVRELQRAKTVCYLSEQD